MTVMQPTILAQRFTLEEFLAFYAGRADGERWQLIDGVAMMMPPPTKAHQRIGSNLAFELNSHFKVHKPALYAYQEAGLIVPDADLFRPEADVAVEDSAADYESYSDKFYLVAEVLSDSNTDRDIEIKRRRYMEHPDNLYGLIIDQKSVMVEVWARRDGWQQKIMSSLADTLSLPEFGISISLQAIYAGTPVAMG